jgi:hypothetical protein
LATKRWHMTKLNLYLSALAAIFISSVIWAAPANACNVSGQVCALKRDGTRMTYPDACQARARKAKILHLGACLGANCGGGIFFITVCAINPAGMKQTYNLCAAENANAVVVSVGPCP